MRNNYQQKLGSKRAHHAMHQRHIGVRPVLLAGDKNAQVRRAGVVYWSCFTNSIVCRQTTR